MCFRNVLTVVNLIITGVIIFYCNWVSGLHIVFLYYVSLCAAHLIRNLAFFEYPDNDSWCNTAHASVIHLQISSNSGFLILPVALKECPVTSYYTSAVDRTFKGLFIETSRGCNTNIIPPGMIANLVQWLDL